LAKPNSIARAIPLAHRIESQFPVAPEYRSNSTVEKEIDGRASDH
jgi:hypothetical protein